MDEPTKKIVKLAHSWKKSKKTQYREIPLFPINEPNQFIIFLINERIKPFLQLQILFHHAKDAEFVMGHEEITYDDNFEDSILPAKQIGSSIVKKVYSREEIFNHILCNFGFTQLLSKPLSIYKADRLTEHGSLRPQSLDQRYYEHPKEECFVIIHPNTKIVLTKHAVFVDEQDMLLQQRIKELIAYHRKAFLYFLKEYRDQCVPHDLYLQWLLTWFPGEIHVRSLGKVK